MYLDFYRFKKSPFHITPDPEFLFLSESHKEASASLIYGIEERKGFIAITGEIGVGKTTILRAYLETADPEKLKVVYIFNAVLSFESLLKQIFNELGLVAEEGADVPERVNQLHRYLIEEYKRDRNVALIIDEAQNMPVETLENLRMLSNLETSKDKLVQIVMVGQPEFEQRLELTELRQLKQRIAIRCVIKPLDQEESVAYIQHRLMRGSFFHNQVFTKGAVRRIVKEARGFPRLINILCDNSLITGFGYQSNPVGEKIVKEVIADFRSRKLRRLSRIWPVAGVCAVVILLGLLFTKSLENRTGKDVPRVQGGNETKVVQPPAPAADVSVPRGHIAGGETSNVRQRVHDYESPKEMEPIRTRKGTAPPEKQSLKEEPADKITDVAKPKQEPAEKPVDVAKPKPEPAEKPVDVAKPKQEPPEKPVDVAKPKQEPPEKAVEVAKPKQEPPEKTVDVAKPKQEPAEKIADVPKSKASPARTVVRGDSVSQVLMETYGYCDPELMELFRVANPQIKNVNRIMVGDQLQLPRVNAPKSVAR